MADAVIVYGSTTGNTEQLAGYIADGMKEAGASVTVRNVTDMDADGLLKYDILVLGSSTWGDGD